MRTVAIISQKGGAGKTTLAVHLAAAATAAGRAALILDTDPQASAMMWAEWRGLAGLGEPDVIDCGAPGLLSKKIAQAADLGGELVVIDTPPHADIMAREACKAADLVLIPCRPKAFDLAAVQTTAGLVKASGKPAFVVFTAGPQRAPATYREATELLGGLGLDVAPVMLTERAVYHHSAGAGKTALEVEPEGKAADEVNALWKWTGEQVNMLTHSRVSRKRRAA